MFKLYEMDPYHRVKIDEEDDAIFVLSFIMYILYIINGIIYLCELCS